MELDDLKNTWQELNNPVKKKETLSPKTIHQMTHTHYHSNLKKIAYPEIIGVIICLAGIVFIGWNFEKLNTHLLQMIGAVSILLLLALSCISLFSIRQLNKTEDVNQSYTETLKQFATQKMHFQKLQRANMLLSYLLLVMVIVLLPKFFGGKDISTNSLYWIFAFPLGYIFLLFYSKWVSKFYNQTLQQTEELLKELTA